MDLLKRITRRQLVLLLLIGGAVMASLIFVYHNQSFYQQPIAKVVESTIISEQEVVDSQGNQDVIYQQQLLAELMNGADKGALIELVNEFAGSYVYHPEFQVGDQLFVTIDQVNDTERLTGGIIDVKRDHYLLMMALLFAFVLSAVGRRQGILAVISLIINAVLMSLGLNVYIQSANIDLLVIMGVVVLIMTIVSLLLISGFKHQTYAAIVATLLGTFLLLVITYAVLKLTNEQGLRFEEMEFLTRPPQAIFMAGVLVGALGAVMDIAVTISSALFSLYDKNYAIADQDLKASGRVIGQDIMGTMTNILFFAYVSGTIPTLLLYFMNGAPLGFTLSMNLSLELTRALAGGIGIVLTIPISLYTTLFFINRKRARL